jgi:hypothetical protein
MLHLAVLLPIPVRRSPRSTSPPAWRCSPTRPPIPHLRTADGGPVRHSAVPPPADQLRAEIEELESREEDGRAARARAERDRLLAELAGVTGIGGRSRRFPDNAERAGIAVGKAIRRALTRTGDTDPVIGEHLRGSVHTGIRCSYRPI